ncbi:MAG: SH3 domain-containing protein, partial [Clostridia bacterium]|nr:SH3 domain-containing protein [Clostridia bacterium]
MPAKYVLGSTRSLLLKAATLLLTFALTLSFFSGANLQAAAKAGDEVEILTSTGYNVRSKASASSTYLGNISSGYTFKVLEVVTGTAHTYGNQWYKFSYSGKDGYIIVNDDPLKQKVTPAVTSPALAKA